MFIGVTSLVVFAWLYGGSIYRERLFFQAMKDRADAYNNLLDAMTTEFGEYKVHKKLSESGLSHSLGYEVNREMWASRLGW